MKAAAWLLAGTLLLLSCKKGKEDPFLSFKSRDKRLQQEWMLKEMTYYDNNFSNGYSMTDELTFDGTTLTSTHTENGGSDQSSGAFAMTITIGKNGSYTMRTVVDDSIVFEQTLPWHWVDTDKKKTRLWLADFPYTYLYGPLTVDRLSSKELILSGSFVNDQTSFTATNRERLVFERKK